LSGNVRDKKCWHLMKLFHTTEMKVFFWGNKKKYIRLFFSLCSYTHRDNTVYRLWLGMKWQKSFDKDSRYIKWWSRQRSEVIMTAYYTYSLWLSVCLSPSLCLSSSSPSLSLFVSLSLSLSVSIFLFFFLCLSLSLSLCLYLSLMLFIFYEDWVTYLYHLKAYSHIRKSYPVIHVILC
jgi:hypothetical protein